MLAPYPQQVILDANGNGTARIQNNNVTVLWVVRQLSVITNPTSGAIARIYQGVNFIGTAYFAGRGDMAGGDPPIYLDPGEYIDAVFTNGPVGGQGILTAYYDEVPR